MADRTPPTAHPDRMDDNPLDVAGFDGVQDGEGEADGDLSPSELADYVSFLRGVPTDNAIARRFIGAAHLLARAVLVQIVFASMRSLDLKWEEAVRITGEMLSMSRSSVVRTLRDVEDVVEFWNANGYAFVDVDGLVEQMSALSLEQLGDALKHRAEEKEG